MIEIKHQNNEKNGLFEIYFDQQRAGEMTYTWAGTDKFIIDHTQVDPKFGGKGLAKKLVVAGVEFARSQGVKVIPLCPYAKVTIERNTDLQDVL